MFSWFARCDGRNTSSDVHVSNEHGLLVRDIDECIESIGERLWDLAARSPVGNVEGDELETEQAAEPEVRAPAEGDSQP